MPSLDAFVSEYRVSLCSVLLGPTSLLTSLLDRRDAVSTANTLHCVDIQLDCTAAVPRLKIGIPATVEHSAEQGIESAKWIAETTQVGSLRNGGPSETAGLEKGSPLTASMSVST